MKRECRLAIKVGRAEKISALAAASASVAVSAINSNQMSRQLQVLGVCVVVRGALHKIGRFRNVPTVGTFINKLKIKFINKHTYGRYVSETTYFM